MQEGSGVPNLQTELNYLDSFKSYCNSSDLGFLSSGGWGRWVGVSRWSAIVYMSSGMFRGKESSNRIELSWLVQDLLNFDVLGSLRLWGWGGWVDGGGGWLGGAPHTRAHVHTCMHAHAHTCMRGKHDNSMQMAAPIGFGEIPGIPYDVIHVCMRARMHTCTCVSTTLGVKLSPPANSIQEPPHPPGGDPRNQSKFNSTWTNQDISILFRRFEICGHFPRHEQVYVFMGQWVDGWVDGWGQVKSLDM